MKYLPILVQIIFIVIMLSVVVLGGLVGGFIC